jgi:hypothetical protein
MLNKKVINVTKKITKRVVYLYNNNTMKREYRQTIHYSRMLQELLNFIQAIYNQLFKKIKFILLSIIEIINMKKITSMCTTNVLQD